MADGHAGGTAADHPHLRFTCRYLHAQAHSYVCAHSVACTRIRTVAHVAFAHAGCRLSLDNNCSQHLCCALLCSFRRSTICASTTNCCCVAACHKRACWVLTWLQLKLTVGARYTPSRAVQSDLMRDNAMGKVSIVLRQGDVTPGHNDYFWIMEVEYISIK